MQIEIKEEDYKKIYNNALKRAEETMYQELLANARKEKDYMLSPKSLRNSAADRVATKVTDSILLNMDELGVIDKCLESAQKRMNTKVQEVLSRGVTIKFSEE